MTGVNCIIHEWDYPDHPYIIWCREHLLPGTWRWPLSEPSRLVFLYEEDAIIFKLKFGV